MDWVDFFIRSFYRSVKTNLLQHVNVFKDARRPNEDTKVFFFLLFFSSFVSLS